MWCFRRGLAFLTVLVLLFFVISHFSCVFAVDDDEMNARTAIANSENEVLSCYGVVADASKAGADVADLLNILNEAGMLLSRAKLAYAMGDFGSAVTFANQSMLELNGFITEADALKKTALQQGYLDFMINVVGSVIGAVAVICGGFAIWFLSKKREERRSA